MPVRIPRNCTSLLPAVVAVALMASAVVAGQAIAQEERPVDDIMEGVKARVVRQCALGQDRLAKSRAGPEKDQAEAFVSMHCECLPPEIQKVERDLSNGEAGATTTPAAFQTRMRAALEHCAARQVRAEIQGRCEKEEASALGVRNKAAYCGCVSEKVRALDDAAIAKAAATTHENYRALARARIEGIPDPTPVPTAVDDIREACKLAGG